MRVRATSGPFPYGFKYRRKGDEFDMDDKAVPMFERLGRVHRVEGDVEEPKKPRKKKAAKKPRRYKRRDMTAE